MRLDQQLIDKRLAVLNEKDGANTWVRIDGLWAVTKVGFDEDEAEFYPASGIPLIIFANNKTGETKLFHINAFRNYDGKE